MGSWIYSHNRKRHQRRINKIVAGMNKSIYNDPLWKGRFVGRQISASWYNYEDGSGAILTAVIELRDKQTNKTKLFRMESSSAGVFNHIFWEMNKFIVDECKVWEEDPRPSYETSIDYRKVK